MALKRQLAILLWAAAVLIAAQLPSVAQAHAGHDHAAPSAVAILSVHDADPAKAKRAAAPAELSSVEDRIIPAAPSSGNCSCCGTGSACCGAIYLFAPAVLPDVSIERQPVGTASSVPPGIDLDALRKPPKSFA